MHANGVSVIKQAQSDVSVLTLTIYLSKSDNSISAAM